MFQVYGFESYAVNERNLDVLSPYWEYPIVKTHLLPTQALSDQVQAKVILLVRDGRDALVSLAHHRSNIIAPGSDYKDNLAEAIAAEGGSHFGGWGHNIRSWIQEADIIIRFEELTTNPVEELKRMEEVLDLPEGDYDKIPTFQSQKFGSPKYGPSLGKNELFFRKGKVGNWKEEMPAELHEKFWYKYEHVMSALGYDHSGDILPLDTLDQIKKKTEWPLGTRIKTTLKDIRSKYFPSRDSKFKLEQLKRIILTNQVKEYINDLPEEDATKAVILDVVDNQLKFTLSEGENTKGYKEAETLITSIPFSFFKNKIEIGEMVEVQAILSNPYLEFIQLVSQGLKYDLKKAISGLTKDGFDQEFFKLFKAEGRNLNYRNTLSRTISKFSEKYIDKLIFKTDDSPVFTEALIKPQVLNLISKLNQRDIELFEFYSNKNQHTVS